MSPRDTFETNNFDLSFETTPITNKNLTHKKQELILNFTNKWENKFIY